MEPGCETLTVPVEPIVLRNADGRLALEARTALVTGGGSGIGRATAVALARNGANVVVSGRRAKPLEETVAAIEANGGLAAAVVADVTKPEGPDALVDAALDTFDGLEIAFNNAGYQEPRARLADQDPGLYDTVFDTNVRALFQCMASQITHMVDNGGGVIINNASVSGVRNSNGGLSLYAASKAAAISLTRSAAMEYAEHHVRINLISPGRVVTEMMLNSRIADMAAVGASLPLRRMGNPMEVANGVVWLASDASSFTVGHNLITDGGFLSS